MPSPSSPEGQWPNAMGPWTIQVTPCGRIFEGRWDCARGRCCLEDGAAVPVEVIPAQSSEATRERLHEAERLLSLFVAKFEREDDRAARYGEIPLMVDARAFLATREDQDLDRGPRA